MPLTARGTITVHPFNPNTRQAEAGRGSLSLGPAWSIQWVPGWPELFCLKKFRQTSRQSEYQYVCPWCSGKIMDRKYKRQNTPRLRETIFSNCYHPHGTSEYHPNISTGVSSRWRVKSRPPQDTQQNWHPRPHHVISLNVNSSKSED